MSPAVPLTHRTRSLKPRSRPGPLQENVSFSKILISGNIASQGTVANSRRRNSTTVVASVARVGGSAAPTRRRVRNQGKATLTPTSATVALQILQTVSG